MCLNRGWLYIFLSSLQPWLSVCQIFYRECPRLDIMPVSWNPIQNVPLLPDKWNWSSKKAPSQQRSAASDAQWHLKALPTRLTARDLLKTPIVWVFVTLMYHHTVGKLLMGSFSLLLFGSGSLPICCESFAWDFSFSACFVVWTFLVAGTSSCAKASLVLSP